MKNVLFIQKTIPVEVRFLLLKKNQFLLSQLEKVPNNSYLNFRRWGGGGGGLWW